MKNNKLYIILSLCCFIAISCDKEIDNKPITNAEYTGVLKYVEDTPPYGYWAYSGWGDNYRISLWNSNVPQYLEIKKDTLFNNIWQSGSTIPLKNGIFDLTKKDGVWVQSKYKIENHNDSLYCYSESGKFSFVMVKFNEYMWLLNLKNGIIVYEGGIYKQIKYLHLEN